MTLEIEVIKKLLKIRNPSRLHSCNMQMESVREVIITTIEGYDYELWRGYKNQEVYKVLTDRYRYLSKTSRNYLSILRTYKIYLGLKSLDEQYNNKDIKGLMECIALHLMYLYDIYCKPTTIN